MNVYQRLQSPWKSKSIYVPYFELTVLLLISFIIFLYIVKELIDCLTDYYEKEILKNPYRFTITCLIFIALIAVQISIVKGLKKQSKKNKRPKLNIEQIRQKFLEDRGFRKSPRLKLNQHKLVSVEQITNDEFEAQKKQLTEQSVDKLQDSKEYKRMLTKKGFQQEKWNWQTYEKKTKQQYESEESVEDEEDQQEREVIKTKAQKPKKRSESKRKQSVKFEIRTRSQPKRKSSKSQKHKRQ